MKGFSAEWLALREPYDARARNPAVLAAVGKYFAAAPAVAVVDLGCGTGATLRAIGARLPARQSWLLVDNDLSLLGKVATLFRPPALAVKAQPVDLVRDLELALDGPLDLVTASAVLDLVSAEWLDRLVVEAAVRRLPLYAALSYDGRISLQPKDAYDAEIIAALNRHQTGDKGFGPALGPQATMQAITRFERVGYSVVQGRSDWELVPDDRSIQMEVLGGMAAAAQDLDDLPVARVAGWLSRRHDLVTKGRSTLRLGHVDFFAAPGAAH
jgi:hypothetical protein